MNIFTDSSNLNDSQRLLPLEGSFNFRDLGGYYTESGKSVAPGLVFRADDLDQLTDSDLRILSEIPIKTYIDFRAEDEAEKAPDIPASTVENQIWLPVLPGNIDLFNKIDSGRGEEAMEEINRLFVRDFQKTFSDFFRIMEKSHKTPLVFHCSAGKDRTGYAAALFLSALGVNRQTILEDYMLSATYVQKKYAHKIAERPELEPAYTVKPSYLRAAFEVIDREYGGMKNYLVHYLKVDLDLLRNFYTK